jgi:hypothetical protein
MKRKVSAVALVVLLLALALGPAGSVVGAQPPTLEEQIEEAIQKGLDWLVPLMNYDGSWGYGCDRVARTGLVVLKFETRAIELGLDPLSLDYDYSDQVASGLDYIMANATRRPLASSQPVTPTGTEMVSACTSPTVVITRSTTRASR